MDWWVDGWIMQVREPRAFNPTVFSGKLSGGCAVFVILCSEEVISQRKRRQSASFAVEETVVQLQKHRLKTDSCCTFL